jgi:hypothetical protein
MLLESASYNLWAQKNDTRGAVYNMNGSVLTITEPSLKMLDRLNDGVHATQILKGEIPAISIKEAVERIQASHDLFREGSITLSPASNLFIEFEGHISNLVITHICRGKDGNYLALYIPDIYYSENFSVKMDGDKKIIKQLVISTDPSTALLLQRKILEGPVGDYWHFFLEQMDYNKKFKVRGIINYAEQKSERGEIEKLELMIAIIQISPLP